MNESLIQTRIQGGWYGVFVGDALGTTLEFQPKPVRRGHTESWHTEITGGGPFRLEAGDFTDDGALTLCLAKALAEDVPPNMNLERELRNYLRWRDEGFCSSNGRCFDIGNQTADALNHFENTGKTKAEETPQGQGNGSLMRAVPVPLWLAGRSDRQTLFGTDVMLPGESRSPAKEKEADQAFRMRAKYFSLASQTTHNSRTCTLACTIYSEAILLALQGNDKETVLGIAFGLTEPLLLENGEFQLVLDALQGKLAWEDFEPTGWVISSLAIAFWGLREFDSFEQGMIEVVNLRGDSDTNGAIYGGLAGAVYGIETIPDRWLAKLKLRSDLEKTLAELAGIK